MRRTVAVALLALGLVLAPIAAAAAPGLAVGGSDEEGVQIGAQSESQNGASERFAPGERVAGAIGAERADLDGEVGARSFGVALSRAETNESAAGVVADRLDRIRTRLATLEERNATLAERYEDGSLSRGAYAVRVAALEAERGSLARQLDATETAVDRLPAAALEGNVVNASAIEQLRTRADELGGPVVRELARSIAGPGLGEDRRPEDRGPDGIPGLDEDGLPGERGGEEDGDGAGDGDDADGDGGDDDRGEDEDRGNGTDGDVGDGSGTEDGGGTDDDSTSDGSTDDGE